MRCQKHCLRRIQLVVILVNDSWVPLWLVLMFLHLIHGLTEEVEVGGRGLC